MQGFPAGRVNALDLATVRRNLNRTMALPLFPAAPAGTPPAGVDASSATAWLEGEPARPLLG